MKQRTLAGLLAAVVLLAGVVIVQATQPREAAQGDPCPADIDNSGNVDVVDFLQLLASWGPCPSPIPVGIGSEDAKPSFWRQWSDGTLDVGRIFETGSITLGIAPPSPHTGVIVGFTVEAAGGYGPPNFGCNDGCGDEFTQSFAEARCMRVYATGYVEWIFCRVCRNGTTGEYCVMWSDWIGGEA